MALERAQKLRTDLATFSPVDAEQGAALRRMQQLLHESTGDPFDRGHFDPGHFTASGFVLSEDGESLLLVFHRKLERWLQPGGHFEPGDADHVLAARREVSEEVGIDELDVLSPLYDLDVHTIPERGREGAHLHFDVRVLFRSKQAEWTASDEVAAARYFPLSELARGGAGVSAAGSDDSVARIARRLLLAP